MGSKALRNAPGQSHIPQIGRFGLSRLLLSISIKSSKPIALLTLTLRCGLGHPKALGGPLLEGGEAMVAETSQLVGGFLQERIGRHKMNW